jgi:multiple sugar transport system permease protein
MSRVPAELEGPAASPVASASASEVARPAAPSSPSTSTPARARRRRGRQQHRLAPYLFIAPNIAVVVVFAIYPLVSNVWTSFTSGSIGTTRLVGLDNYKELFGDPGFTDSLKNTLFYTLLLVPVTVALSLLIAVGMNRVMPLKNTIRAAYLMPYLLSWSASGLVWRQMFARDNGIINTALSAVGLPTSGWLLDPHTTIISLAIVGIWAGLGYYMMIYLAGLQSVPTSLYEAARLDGASPVQQFRYVTLPALRPITSLVVILSVMASFRVFEQIYVMTGGGPGRASFVLVLYVYIKAFTEFSPGYAAAIATGLFLCLLVVTLALQKLLKSDD